MTVRSNDRAVLRHHLHLGYRRHHPDLQILSAGGASTRKAAAKHGSAQDLHRRLHRLLGAAVHRLGDRLSCLQDQFRGLDGWCRRGGHSARRARASAESSSVPWIGFPVAYAVSGILLTVFGYFAMLLAQ